MIMTSGLLRDALKEGYRYPLESKLEIERPSKEYPKWLQQKRPGQPPITPVATPT